jgi:hypothetical protein
MKKLIIFFLLSVFLNLHIQAQEKDDIETQVKNELKLNGFNLIAFTFVDLSYETLLNEESSFGVAVLFNIGSEEEILDEIRNFSITPFYRHFFSKQYAEGFFVEGFGMLNSGNQNDIYDDFELTIPSEGKYTDFALGISVGGKFVTPRGFVVEIYTGLGRNLLGSENAPDIVSRGGISLGYRF